MQQNAGLQKLLFVHPWIMHNIDDCNQFILTFGDFLQIVCPSCFISNYKQFEN